MGREIKRVPMDFAFPVGESYADHSYEQHRETCSLKEHDDCEYPYCDPPTGDGWQLWQTVSDGPISAVFATADELIDWMCQPCPPEQQSRFEPGPYPPNPWAQGWRREIAEPFVKSVGWAPSCVIAGGVMMSGPEFVVKQAREKSS